MNNSLDDSALDRILKSLKNIDNRLSQVETKLQIQPEKVGAYYITWD